MKNIHIKKFAAITVIMGMMLTSTACSGQADMSAVGVAGGVIASTAAIVSGGLVAGIEASAELNR